VPADRDSQLAGLRALNGVRHPGERDGRPRLAPGNPAPGNPAPGNPAPGNSARGPAPSAPAGRTREPPSWPAGWTREHPSWPPPGRPLLPHDRRAPPAGPDALDSTAQFRAALSTLGPRKARKLHGRLSRWKPRYWPPVLSFLVILVVVGWFTEPYAGPLGLALTIAWTWPIVSTLVGIRGIHRTRKALRASQKRWQGSGAIVCQDVLIVVVPTIGRHDTHPALERSILSFIAYLPRCFPRLRIDLIIDEGCEAEARVRRLAARSPLVRLVVVPSRYRTRHGTKFKARANHFAHELRIHQREDADDIWVLHMDDDTGVGPDTATAMARFIEEQAAAGRDAKHMAQGILTYPREYAVNRLTWLADSVRPADDVARFSALTGGGTPRAGLHGELLLVRASVEAEIGWDFGPRSIVEDAQFALIFCEWFKGRSAWFGGRCYGASPATVRDFIRQRERWCWGLASLVCNRSIRLRDRAFLAYSMVSWVLGPFQNVAMVLLIGVLIAAPNTAPVSLFFVPIWVLNTSYTIWMYWEGLRLNAGVSARGRRKFWEPFAVIVLLPFFGMLEGLGGLRGFLKFARRAENKFIVIAKPS
jgi:beta-1,4-mannosyltransferase